MVILETISAAGMENWCTSLSAIRIHLLNQHQSHAAELTLWSAKLVSQMSPRRNSAKGTLTHSTALRSLITTTPLSGTLKSGMVRWAQESAAGTESGRRSP